MFLAGKKPKRLGSETSPEPISASPAKGDTNKVHTSKKNGASGMCGEVVTVLGTGYKRALSWAISRIGLRSLNSLGSFDVESISSL